MICVVVFPNVVIDIVVVSDVVVVVDVIATDMVVISDVVIGVIVVFDVVAGIVIVCDIRTDFGVASDVLTVLVVVCGIVVSTMALSDLKLQCSRSGHDFQHSHFHCSITDTQHSETTVAPVMTSASAFCVRNISINDDTCDNVRNNDATG